MIFFRNIFIQEIWKHDLPAFCLWQVRVCRSCLATDERQVNLCSHSKWSVAPFVGGGDILCVVQWWSVWLWRICKHFDYWNQCISSFPAIKYLEYVQASYSMRVCCYAQKGMTCGYLYLLRWRSGSGWWFGWMISRLGTGRVSGGCGLSSWLERFPPPGAGDSHTVCPYTAFVALWSLAAARRPFTARVSW